MPVEISGAVEATRKWWRLGRHVVIRGDTGAGKSTVLDRLVRDATRQGSDALRFSATEMRSDLPFGALLGHDAVAGERTSARPSVQGLAKLLGGELGTTRSVVAVDDIELLDPASAQVVDELLARPGVLLVATSRPERAGDAGSAGHRLLTGHVTAEVQVAPLGFRGMSALLATRLRGTPDAGLISTMVARSAGNPGATVALVDAALHSGAVALVDGVWTQVRPWEADGLIVPALTRRLPAEAVEALEMLAWSGPVTLDDARELVGPGTLAQLGEQRRIAVFPTSRGDDVTISPPALADALRARLGTVRRRLLAHQAEAAFGSAYEPVPAPHGELVERLVADTGDDEQSARMAELVALVHERAAVQDASRRAAWRADPTVVNAVLYLDALMALPAPEHLDEVFAGTRVGPDDDPADVAAFVMRQAQWMLWQRQDVEEVEQLLGRAAASLGPLGALLAAQAQVFRYSHSGLPADLAFLERVERDAHGEPRVRIWTTLARVAFLLERGRAEEALQILEDAPEHEGAAQQRWNLEAARSDVLLLLGRLEEAEQAASRLLEESYRALDPLGIRLHSGKLAEVLYLTGRPDAAWRVLSSSLRLGPPSPFGVAYYERTLALATVIRADAGDLDLARVLEREMDAYPVTYRAVLGSMSTWARAAIRYEEGRAAEADTLLREQALADAAGRSWASALLLWTARRAPCSPEQADLLDALHQQAPLPLFGPLVGLHLAMARGDEEDIRAAMALLHADPADHLARTALEVIDARRLRAGSRPLEQAEIDTLIRRPLARRRRGTIETATPPAELSDREYEVALLARSGLSNREIAGRLFLSPRTVENHMYRLLRKLGLERREDLADRWDASAGSDGRRPDDDSGDDASR